MLKTAYTLLIFLIASCAVAYDVKPSQFLVAEDAQAKLPVHHVAYLQAPNGNQGRVIIIGPANKVYDATINVQISGIDSTEAHCQFIFTDKTHEKTPSCILDFSDPNKTSVINLNQEAPKT